MPGAFDFESGVVAARHLLSAARRPSAIFASNDDMAAGVLSVAHDMGLDVPQDLSVVGFDDTMVARMVWPQLTTIRQPTRELAHEATQLLLGGAQLTHRRLPHDLVERASVAPINPDILR
jgi:LacI family transcriptional regulator